MGGANAVSSPLVNNLVSDGGVCDVEAAGKF